MALKIDSLSASGAVALHEAIEGCGYAEGVNRFIAIVRVDGVKVHLHHQLVHHPPINGVNGAGVVVVERSFGVGDSADVAHRTSSYNAFTIISQVGGMRVDGFRGASALTQNHVIRRGFEISNIS